MCCWGCHWDAGWGSRGIDSEGFVAKPLPLEILLLQWEGGRNLPALGHGFPLKRELKSWHVPDNDHKPSEGLVVQDEFILCFLWIIPVLSFSAAPGKASVGLKGAAISPSIPCTQPQLNPHFPAHLNPLEKPDGERGVAGTCKRISSWQSQPFQALDCHRRWFQQQLRVTKLSNSILMSVIGTPPVK